MIDKKAVDGKTLADARRRGFLARKLNGGRPNPAVDRERSAHQRVLNNFVSRLANVAGMPDQDNPMKVAPFAQRASELSHSTWDESRFGPVRNAVNYLGMPVVSNAIDNATARTLPASRDSAYELWDDAVMPRINETAEDRNKAMIKENSDRSYVAGFLSKCASAGVPQEAAFYMLKLAQIQYAKPGYNIFGQPLAAPTPTKQQKANATAAGVSQPATVMPKPVSRRQTTASALGAADPVKPGNNTGLTGSTRKAGVTAPVPKATTGSVSSQPSASAAPAAAAASAPKQKAPQSVFQNKRQRAQALRNQQPGTYEGGVRTQDQNGNPVQVQPNQQASVDAASQARSAMSGQQQQPAFQPTADQQKLQQAWDKMTPEQHARNLQRAGMTEEQFNALDEKSRYETMGKMRDSFKKPVQQPPAQQASAPNPASGSDMVRHPDGVGMIDRASYDRLMQARAQNKQPTREQVADRLAAGRGVANAANYREQQARLAGQGGTPGNRMPRYSNGALAMIDLHGRPISPTLRGT